MRALIEAKKILDVVFEGIEIVELDETTTLSETAASSVISSCNGC
ncbi:MAG: thiazolylpeptide-type bacteriocin [Lachnospiraceae bacterium]|nr:thiazolylpeptide-type bacteriocin [Lachnospiraceae bacterium]